MRPFFLPREACPAVTLTCRYCRLPGAATEISKIAAGSAANQAHPKALHQSVDTSRTGPRALGHCSSSSSSTVEHELAKLAAWQCRSTAGLQAYLGMTLWKGLSLYPKPGLLLRHSCLKFSACMHRETPCQRHQVIITHNAGKVFS